MAESRETPEYFQSWKPPLKNLETHLTGLLVNNSLSPAKLVELIPSQGRRLNWYMCGPTVYDASHLGHARTYLSFDMIRRVLRDYFGYDVALCMNITDIDDKIIIRSITVNEDFDKFARKWEEDFFDDMKALGVELPDIITRVSEFVPEIIKFISKIIENGYAYQSNGSVYFDLEVYNNAKTVPHHYGKLAPGYLNDMKLLREGEGALTSDADKRMPRDFALWKKAKPGEPKWPSPWGEGRPGWHIECSAMANHAFGGTLDIHSGGVDLKFPHHANEIAQAEAFYENEQWVNYFLHSGHLNMEGLKMSKSLKNFITIKELLREYNARHLRLLFLLHRYDVVQNYTEDSLREAVDKDARYKKFFLNLKANMREHPINENQMWSEQEFELFKLFGEKKLAIHKKFLDNFNTPGVIDELDKLISATNTYISNPSMRYPLLNSISDYIIFIFKVLGLQYNKKTLSQGKETNQSADIEEIAAPYIDSLAKFRDKVRDAVRKKEFGAILQASDELRDDILPNLGVRLEDKPWGSIWKYEIRDILLREREKKFKTQEKELANLLKNQEEKDLKEVELLKKSQIHLKYLFINQTDLYSKFDELGIPTHDKEGKELSKGLLEHLKKEYKAQEELNRSWLQQNKEL